MALGAFGCMWNLGSGASQVQGVVFSLKVQSVVRILSQFIPSPGIMTHPTGPPMVKSIAGSETMTQIATEQATPKELKLEYYACLRSQAHNEDRRSPFYTLLSSSTVDPCLINPSP